MTTAAILAMMGGYLVREVGTEPEITTYNTRPFLEGAVALAEAIQEVSDEEIEIIDLRTGKPADESAILEILRKLEG